jgi:hypothetical protein
VHFRKRIGVKGFNLIFKMSVALHGKQAQESSVLIDTTVPIVLRVMLLKGVIKDCPINSIG